MTVGQETVYWREGKCFVFDDSTRHSVLNATDRERAIPLFDFDRPMRWPSSAIHRLILMLLKRTACYHDARRSFPKHERVWMTNADRDRIIVDAMQRIAD